MKQSALKSFFVLLGIVCVLSVIAAYLPEFFPQPKMEAQPSPQTNRVKDDGSLPFIEANAPFNLSNDEKFLATGTFGLLTEIAQDETSGKITLKFDQTKLLKGEEAEKVARTDLGCNKAGAPAECVGVLTTNGQYISNPIKKVFTYQLSPDAEIRLLTSANAQTGTGVKLSQPVDLAKLLVADDVAVKDDQKLTVPVWIKEKNGVVTYVEQQQW